VDRLSVSLKTKLTVTTTSTFTQQHPSGLQVSFSSLTMNTCTLKRGTVRILAAGICTIRASMSGDGDYNPAVDVDRSFLINKADAVVVVTPYDVIYDGQPHIAYARIDHRESKARRNR
jgi:hypothetical protein